MNYVIGSASLLAIIPLLAFSASGDGEQEKVAFISAALCLVAAAISFK